MVTQSLEHTTAELLCLFLRRINSDYRTTWVHTKLASLSLSLRKWWKLSVPVTCLMHFLMGIFSFFSWSLMAAVPYISSKVLLLTASWLPPWLLTIWVGCFSNYQWKPHIVNCTLQASQLGWWLLWPVAEYSSGNLACSLGWFEFRVALVLSVMILVKSLQVTKNRWIWSAPLTVIDIFFFVNQYNSHIFQDARNSLIHKHFVHAWAVLWTLEIAYIFESILRPPLSLLLHPYPLPAVFFISHVVIKRLSDSSTHFPLLLPPAHSGPLCSLV